VRVTSALTATCCPGAQVPASELRVPVQLPKRLVPLAEMLAQATAAGVPLPLDFPPPQEGNSRQAKDRASPT